MSCEQAVALLSHKVNLNRKLRPGPFQHWSSSSTYEIVLSFLWSSPLRSWHLEGSCVLLKLLSCCHCCSRGERRWRSTPIPILLLPPVPQSKPIPAKEHFFWFRIIEWITKWLGLEGTSEIIYFQPLPGAAMPTTASGRSSGLFLSAWQEPACSGEGCQRRRICIPPHFKLLLFHLPTEMTPSAFSSSHLCLKSHP